MSANIHNVFNNFIYRINLIVPTSNIVKQKFYDIDPSLVEPDDTSGFVRAYYVEWRDSNADQWATDSDHREAAHNFHVVVHYPLVLPWEKMFEVISKDRHDLAYILRRKDNAVGVVGNASLDCGLMSRFRTGDQLNTNGPVWTLTTSWQCKIQESEI